MKNLTNKERENAEKYIEMAKVLAKKATCMRALCGSVLVKDGEVIGEGYNSPPGNNESERRCSFDKKAYDPKVTEKTCCIHAEQRAIIDALRRNPTKVAGSILYFARYYPNGELRLNQGGSTGKNQLYCTACGKLMFDVGVEEFVLPHINGFISYEKDEYLRRAYEYGKK